MGGVDLWVRLFCRVGVLHCIGDGGRYAGRMVGLLCYWVRFGV